MTPAEVSLSILGSRFRVVSDDDRMVELVRQLWEPFVAEPSGGGVHEMRVETRDAGWRLGVPDESPIGATDPWLVASSLRNSLSRRAIREAASIVPLHAAAVERDGVFAVLSGPPKAGKTTLLLELLARDWLLVTDDLVPLDPETLSATPFPKPLSVREPDRWARFAAGWQVPAWLPPPTAVGLLPATALHLSRARTYSPSLLVFPQFDGDAEPEGRRLTPAETVAWAADNLHSRGPGAVGVLPTLARLSVRVSGHVLRYGSTQDALRLLEKCLAAPNRME